MTQNLRYLVPPITQSYYDQFRTAIYGTLTSDLLDIATAIQEVGHNVENMTLDDLWGLYPNGFASYAQLEYFYFYFGHPNFPGPNNGPYKVVFRYRPPGMSNDTSLRVVDLYKN